jgi:hypothetical protein
MIDALAAFHDLSLGTLPPGGTIRHITAAVTLTTAGGGEANAFISVRLFYKLTDKNNFIPTGN